MKLIVLSAISSAVQVEICSSKSRVVRKFAASLDWDSDEDVSPEEDCTDSRGMPFHDPLPGSPADLAHKTPCPQSNVAIETTHGPSSSTASTVSCCDQYPLFNGSANKQ